MNPTAFTFIMVGIIGLIGVIVFSSVLYDDRIKRENKEGYLGLISLYMACVAFITIGCILT